MQIVIYLCSLYLRFLFCFEPWKETGNNLYSFCIPNSLKRDKWNQSVAFCGLRMMPSGIQVFRAKQMLNWNLYLWCRIHLVPCLFPTIPSHNINISSSGSGLSHKPPLWSSWGATLLFLAIEEIKRCNQRQIIISYQESVWIFLTNIFPLV